jgi:RNA polymerase sigma-70 factor (ECF subfamily)
VSTAVKSEERVFESLYRLNRPVIYAYALSRLRNPSDAEDATQTTFLNAYTAIHRGVTPRDDVQWLIAIARNVCRDRFRDAKRRPQEEPLEDWTPVLQPEAPEYSVGEIAKEIAELHPRHRQIILMREFEGRSYGEISDKLGVSQAAVQALLVRARRTLRDELELGITCSQARRISLRHLNGVAVRDERRALNRHLRKCSDCATFVGRRPHSVATLLLLPTLPFRKLWMVVVGTSGAPTVGTTAGSGGAIAAKVLALTAIGSTAVGVTVKEITVPSTPAHRPVAPKTIPATSVHHASVRFQSPPASSWTAFRAPAARSPVTHATEQTAHHSGRTVTGSSPAGIVSPTSSVVDLPSVGAPAESVPETSATPDQTGANQAAAAGQDSTETPASSAGSAAPPVTNGPTAPPADIASPASTDSAAAGATPAAAQIPLSSAPAGDATPPVAAGTTPAVTPSTPAPTPAPQSQGSANANANGSGNGVGHGGTPPGQEASRGEPPVHVRP